jgi:hypothetical protein
LDFWNESKPQRASMEGSTPVGRNQSYLLMLLNHTSAQDAMNQMRPLSISWWANIWVPKRSKWYDLVLLMLKKIQQNDLCPV